MFALPPSWSPLPSGPPIAPMIVIGLPALLVVLVGSVACAAIVGIHLVRKRAARTSRPLIEIRQPQPGTRVVAGARR